MAISIGGTVVIDNDRNIINANDIRVGVVTITGSTGDIETPGTITAGGITLPVELVSISPSIGATEVNITSNIVMTFNQVVGIATTGTIVLRSESAAGPGIQTIGVSTNNFSSDSPFIVRIKNLSMPGVTTIFPVIPSEIIQITGGSFIGLNTTGGDSYSFTTAAGLGFSCEGGFLICQAASLKWIVSTYGAEVSRNWYSRNDANTRAQQVSGCTGWFVPTVSQLQNPGYICRSFWGPSPCFSSCLYWSSTESDNANANRVNFLTGTSTASAGGSPYVSKNFTYCVRAFRCVTY
jgi:hypothetical protein